MSGRFRPPVNDSGSSVALALIPAPDPRAKRAEDLGGLEGDVPSPIDPPRGCRFHTSCPHAMPHCGEREPELRTVEAGHRVACFLHDQE